MNSETAKQQKISFDSGVRVLIVPGLNNSGAEHWQTRWESMYPHFERVEQAHWDQPNINVWSKRLDQVLQADHRPTLIVAHSFGCLTTVHSASESANTYASKSASNIIGALLVAPADPIKFGVESIVKNTQLPFPSILIGSMNDPWLTSARASQWAKTWGSEFVNIGVAGHINAESRLGSWEFGLLQLQRLVAEANVIRA